ncbi:MAG: energy transducer TonB [Agitococcus sp.]|nr:energy transducer TonB [Agitococcus sp.]
MSELTAKIWLNQQQAPTVPHFRWQKLAALLLVFCLHGVLAWLVLLGMKQPQSEPTTPPTIQAMMIVSEAPPVPVAPPILVVKPPLPMPEKLVTTIPPVKNTPPSEKAITQPDVAPVVEKTPPKEAVLPEVAPQPAPQQLVKEPEAVIPPRSDAAHLNNPAPSYPSMSLRLAEQGRVVLDVYILANGRVGELRIKQSSGFKRLDDAAMQAVKKWQYVPARRGNEAISFWYIQPLSFSINP